LLNFLHIVEVSFHYHFYHVGCQPKQQAETSHVKKHR
jgi:hypothetical protein